MFKDNALLAQLKQNIQQDLPKVEGKIKATDKSYGFLETEKGKSHFIAPPLMKKVMHGDIVSAVLRTDKGKTQAEPEALVTQAVNQFIGRVVQKNNKLYVQVDGMPQIKPIKAKGISGQQLVDNDWVLATLTCHPLSEGQADNSNFQAQIDQLIASAQDSYAPWAVTLAKYNLAGANLPTAAPQDLEQWPINDQWIERVDLTSELFFTIDGEKTQDMDDAINISQLDNGNWQLIIAIADPSAYIAQGSEHDSTAKERGYTHYLPGRNITMLPESISHDICSLRAGEKRPVMLCKMQINAKGGLTDQVEFNAGWIKSSYRLNYAQVSGFIAQQTDCWQPESQLADALIVLSEMAFARGIWRANHTQVFDDRTDYRFEIGEDNQVTNIRVEHHSIANQMVEESMLLANFCGAKLLSDNLNNGIFNTHPGIDPDKVAKASVLLKEHGYIYSKEHLLTVVGYCQLQREMTSRNDGKLSGRMRKFQNYGTISEQPLPHFGLGTEQYATWTSPIRKYGDLLNHRLIKAIISKDYQAEPVNQAHALLLKEQRDNQRLVERDIGNWLYVDYLASKVESKQQFSAKIFNINRAGFMAKLIENGAVVFVPLGNLHPDRKSCKCDTEAGQIIIDGEVRFCLNQRVELVISQANVEKRSLIASPAPTI
ncbi:MAG: exoribonuclease II [Gammaproteobacteria bacterium]|nr:exoribonuclease II [Gammaproteobacteria bacterium]